MSTTFETELRHRAEASVPAGLSLEVHQVLAAGRRRRRSRTVGALGACAALLVGGVVLGRADLAAPTQSAAAPPTIGYATAVEVAPGVRATTVLGRQRTADGGVWWDSGLVPFGDPAGLHFGFAPATGQQLMSATRAGSVPDGVSIGVFDGTTAAFTRTGVVTWPRVSSPHDVGSVAGWSDAGDDITSAWSLTGYVTTKVSAPHAVLLIPAGITTAPAYVELPTFRSPVDPGASLFAATVTQANRGWDQVGFSPAVVFVGSDGSVDLNGECDRLSLAECQVKFGGALIPALESVGGKV